MQLKKLEENIITAIQELSDEQIVQIDAGRIGLTAFKRDLRVEVTPGLTQDTWHDLRLRSYWEELYGPGHFVELYGGGEENVYDMAYTDPETDECELDEKLEDPEWVANYAAASRNAMMAYAGESAELVIDSFSGLDD